MQLDLVVGTCARWDRVGPGGIGWDWVGLGGIGWDWVGLGEIGLDLVPAPQKGWSERS